MVDTPGPSEPLTESHNWAAGGLADQQSTDNAMAKGLPPYEALVRYKRSFGEGSEREYVARAIRDAAETWSRPAVIADVGSSDCRNTRKILEAVGATRHPYGVTAIEPDRSAVLRIPPDCPIRHVIESRFEDVSPTPDLLADVVLFSHSLYYFADPEFELRRAMDFLRPGGTIVVAMWDSACQLRSLAIKLYGESARSIHATALFERVKRLGAPARWYGTWDGTVRFADWRSSEQITLAALATLGRGTGDHERLTLRDARHALADLGDNGRRSNSVFSLVKQ